MKQYARIARVLPLPRGNVKIPNHTLLSALIYRLENGCKWRALPEIFGNWHTIYARLDRWAEHGVLELVYTALVGEGLCGKGYGVFTLYKRDENLDTTV